MKWPLQTPAVSRSEIPLHNLQYLHAPGADDADPTILWGTDVDVARLQAFLDEARGEGPVLITRSHVLLQATAQALARHPWLNRRVVGRRVFAFRELNLHMASHNPRNGEVDIVFVPRAARLTLQQIGGLVWKSLLDCRHGRAPVDHDRRRMKAMPAWLFHVLLSFYRWLDRRWPLPTFGRLDDLRCAAVLVNDLAFRGAPSMRCYKPTRFPDETVTINVTLGPIEEKVVVRDGQPVAGKVAPLFVRADHRIADAYQVGAFVATLRDFLQHPAQLDALAAEHLSASDAAPSGEGRHPAPSRKAA